MDLATPQLEVDRVVGDQRAEALGDAAELERERVAGHQLSSVRGYLTSVGMSVISPAMICCLTFSIWSAYFSPVGVDLAEADAVGLDVEDLVRAALERAVLDRP